MYANDNRDSNNQLIAFRDKNMQLSCESDKELACSTLKNSEKITIKGTSLVLKQLKGIFRIGGQRNFNFPLQNKEYFLTCKRFWCDDVSPVCLTEEGVILIEIFTICNDESFLQRVCNNYLLIELSKINAKLKHDTIGMLRLPLHQFFIGFRDANITNRLCKDQFPVLSTDAWLPIVDSSSGGKAGEVECLLAIGTEVQIENLQISRNWKVNGLALPASIRSEYTLPNLRDIKQNINKPPNYKGNCKGTLLEAKPALENKTHTSVLLNVLQKPLAIPSTIEGQFSNVDYFRMFLEVKSAKGLPLNPVPKKQKKMKNSSAVKGIHLRFPPGEEPNTYVTFQANEGDGPMVKSHEGMVYYTNIAEKTSNPIWNKSFYISLNLDYLINKKKSFILKIWKKGSWGTDPSKALPSPLEDSIIGFAAIDNIDRLSAGGPYITSWLNITDFNGHVTGQIQVAVHVLDDTKNMITSARKQCENQIESLLNSFESSFNMNNINIGGTIKRKFVELEEISQRLRARLQDVTGLPDREVDMADTNDEDLDQFERDINTTVNEDDSETDFFSSHADISIKNTHSSF